jgi:hypothetical protein
MFLEMVQHFSFQQTFLFDFFSSFQNLFPLAADFFMFRTNYFFNLI